MTKRCGSEQMLRGDGVQEGVQSGDLCIDRGTIPVFLRGPCDNLFRYEKVQYMYPESLLSFPANTRKQWLSHSDSGATCVRASHLFKVCIFLQKFEILPSSVLKHPDSANPPGWSRS